MQSERSSNDATPATPTTPTTPATVYLRTTAERAYVILRPVRLFELEKLLSESGTEHNEKSRVEFAQKLAFGEG